MLTALRAYSSWSSAPTLPLSEGGRPDTDLIQIREVAGLEPVKATINTTSLGSIDGESFDGTTVASRNIVLTLGLNPDWDMWTMSSLRRLLYTYFMPKRQVRLVFENDDMPTVEIYGYVESCEPNIFTKDPEFQVSIICPDPYFTALEATVITGVSNNVVVPITYDGTIETGINLEISEAALPAPILFDIQLRGLHFQLNSTVSSTKYIVLNSVAGKKYVHQIEQGTGLITNLLANVEEGYVWPILEPGVNNFYIATDNGAQDWRMSYFARFGGL